MYRSRHRFQVAEEEKEGDVPYHALWTAIRTIDTDDAIRIVKAGANVNVRYEEGDTPLILAVDEKMTRLVPELLRAGANVNMRNKYNITPLHAACIAYDLEIAEMLLNAGANVNAVDKYLRTPLFLAVQYPNKPLVRLLLNSGADPYIKNRKGMLPIDLARVGGGIYKLLRRAMLRTQIEPLLTASARGEIFDERLYDKGLYRLMSKYM